MAKFPEAEQIDTEHGWRERRGFHPRDALLRKHGYRIHARPRGEAIWEFAGETMTFTVALVRVRRWIGAEAFNNQLAGMG